MATKKSQEKNTVNKETKIPKSRQLIRMLSFRIVPEYYKKIENVADDKNTTVSALIRRYIKEGMIKDLEIKGTDTSFRIE
jgi:predicted DNA-binding protein